MKFKEGMSEKDKIDALERQILVHSMIYYEMNKSVISDAEFDKLAKLLVKKINKYGEKKMSKTQYWYVFNDFDGNTGFDLIHRLKKADKERIKVIATYVLRLSNG